MLKFGETSYEGDGQSGRNRDRAIETGTRDHQATRTPSQSGRNRDRAIETLPQLG